MKKIYLQPIANVCDSRISMILAGSITTSTGSGSYYFGGGNGNSDEGKGGIAANGSEDDDDVFTQGAKYRFYTGF